MSTVFLNCSLKVLLWQKEHRTFRLESNPRNLT